MMHVGIDLGTSNSAIVGTHDGALQLFKAEDGRDYLPSVLHFSRTGAMSVGARAYAQADLAPDSVAQGFKRLMGTGGEIPLKGSRTAIAPEEASAEVIRALLRQMETATGDRAVTGAIITIPAAFNQMQSEATIRAAQAAGLDHVGLLQEPIAAALAALENTSRKDGRFLVYDIGGGTFDVALVEATAGAVTVLAHEGINMLGGRDFDRMIVDSVLRPWLAKQFDLPADATLRPAWKRFFAIARYRAELAKIELSTREEATLYIGDDEARVEDERGEPVWVECTLTRAQLEALVEDQVARSIGLCRKMLIDNGLSHEDVDRVVLIGGPSKMPLIRRRVAEELGIAVDLDTDPMTAVARGAAIFAESRDWSQERGARKPTRARAQAHGAIVLTLDYLERVAQDETRLRLSAELPEPGMGTSWRYRITGEGGFDSGFEPFAGQARITLRLPRMGENRFTVGVTGENGDPACPDQTILVVRTAASASAIPATQTVSVKAVTGTLADRQDTLVPLISKGTPLPASDVEHFRLRETITAHATSHFDVELYNQVEGVSDPRLNRSIGVFRFRGDEVLCAGETLPAGTRLNVHWEMDDNGLIRCQIELPDHGLRLDKRNAYMPSAGHRNFEGEEGAQLAKAQLASVAQALMQARKSLSEQDRPTLGELEARAEQTRATLTHAAEAEAHRMAWEEALLILQELARLRDRPANVKAVILCELETFEDHVADLLTELGSSLSPEVVGKVQELGRNVREMLAAQDWPKARQTFETMQKVFYRALLDDPGFVAGLFATASRQRYAALDKSAHDTLVAQGQRALAAGDSQGLRQIIGALYANRHPGELDSTKAAQLASLVR